MSVSISAIHDVLRPLGVHIGTRAPRELPARFLRVYRIGGATEVRGVIDRPMVIIEIFAESDSEAEALAFAARDLMNDPSAWHPAMRRVDWASGITSLDDPTFPTHYRYTMTAQVTVRSK